MNYVAEMLDKLQALVSSRGPTKREGRVVFMADWQRIFGL